MKAADFFLARRSCFSLFSGLSILLLLFLGSFSSHVLSASFALAQDSSRLVGQENPALVLSPRNLVESSDLSLVVSDSLGRTIRIVFSLNGIERRLPLLKASDLNGLPRSLISQQIIKELVRSGKYKDVLVETQLPEHSSVADSQEVVWHVRAAPLRTIYSVSILGVGFSAESQYKAKLRSKAGQLYLEQYIEEDVRNLEELLRDRGYPKANVKSVQVRGVPNGTVSIEFVAERGIVCRISQIKINGDESLFNIVALPIELGAVCNLPQIRKSLKAEEERLRSIGYLDAQVHIKEIDYSTDESTASLTVQLDRGKFTQIEAIDLATGLVRSDFLQGDDGLNAIDLNLLGEEDLRREILNFYLEDGYAQAKVTGPKSISLNSGDRILRFFVEKGPQITIGQIDFVGDVLPVSRSDALDAMGLNPGILSQSIPYVEKRLPEYRDGLQRLLFEKGFGDAEVDLPKVTISRGGGAAGFVFNIRLGKVYLLSEVTYLGRPDGFEIDDSSLGDIVELDEPLSATAIASLRDSLRKQLIESGYYYAQITDRVQVEKENDSAKYMRFALEINAGPIVRIRNLYTEGEQYGKSERIKLVSGLESGDIFSPARLEKARVRILRYDLFGSISVEPFDLSAIERKETELDVVIRCSGRPGYAFSLTPGYGSRNGYRFGVDFVRNEVNESGLRFNASTAFSQDKEQLPIGRAPQQVGRKITLGLTEPLIRVGAWVSPFDARVLFGLEVSNLSFETRLFETYELSLKWRPTLLGLDLNFDWGFAHEWSQTISSVIGPLEAINNPSLQIHEIILRGSFDSRDNLEWPRKGMLHEIETQHARFGLDSDVSYDRFSVSSNFFFPFLSRWAHAFSTGFVTISDVVNRKSSTVTAPASRRAGLTGRATVRGFPEQGRSLGPLIWLDINRPAGDSQAICNNAVRSIGATNVIYGKYELRYRTTYFSDMLGFAWFVDTGTALFSDNEVRTIESKVQDSIENTNASAGECVVEQARLYQPKDVRKSGRDFMQAYLASAFVSSGIGIRFIISNFASISFDWGLPVQDPALRDGASCSTISESESSDDAPKCIKRDRQDRLLGAIPFPGAFHFGIGATL